MVPSNIYDPAFKALRKKQWCLGASAGLLGGGGSQTFLSYIWWDREFSPKGVGGGHQMFCLSHENVTGPTPSNK